MKKSLSVILSLIMIISAISFMPFSASAAEGPKGSGVIVFMDEFGAWGVDGYDYTTNYDSVVFYAGADVDTEYYYGESPVGIAYKGASYDEKTNTLTLDNVNDPLNGFMVQITDMGDLTIKLIGTSKLWQIYSTNTNITFTGSGTLNVNPPVSYSQGKGTEWEFIVENEILGGQLEVENGWVHIEGGATLKTYSENDEYGSLTIVSFSPITENELNSKYLVYGSASPSFKWDSSSSTNPAYDDPVPVQIEYVEQAFPATELLELKGAQSEYKYWVKSDQLYAGYPCYHPIYENADGVWVEARFEGFQYNNGNYYAFHENIGLDKQQTDGVYFAKYQTTEGMPSGLVRYNSMAIACLLANNYWYSDQLFTSEDIQFALHNRGTDDYRNNDVNPVDPPVNNNRSYDMYYIKKVGNTEYLLYCENIDAYSSEAVYAAAAEKGYERQVTHHDEITYYYYSVPGTVTFKGGNHTHKYTSKVTKAATCGTDGVKTYTCTCGDTYTKIIKATGKHTPKDDGKITKTTSTTYTVTYTCKVCKKTYTETFDKKANTLKASGKTVSIKASDVKSKNKTISQSKAFSVSKAKGKVTYTKSSGNSKITVSSAGKVTVKKALKKGTYKIKVKVKAAGNTNYKSATKTVTVTIKVK